MVNVKKLHKQHIQRHEFADARFFCKKKKLSHFYIVFWIFAANERVHDKHEKSNFVLPILLKWPNKQKREKSNSSPFLTRL